MCTSLTDYKGVNLSELQWKDKFIEFGKTVGLDL